MICKPLSAHSSNLRTLRILSNLSVGLAKNALPLGEGAGRRPRIDGTMDDSGLISQMGNLRTLRTFRNLSHQGIRDK